MSLAFAFFLSLCMLHSGLGIDRHKAFRFKSPESFPLERCDDARLLANVISVDTGARTVAPENTCFLFLVGTYRFTIPIFLYIHQIDYSDI
jgi:hypothetical protein